MSLSTKSVFINRVDSRPHNWKIARTQVSCPLRQARYQLFLKLTRAHPTLGVAAELGKAGSYQVTEKSGRAAGLLKNSMAA